jgi:hypothetical protein
MIKKTQTSPSRQTIKWFANLNRKLKWQILADDRNKEEQMVRNRNKAPKSDPTLERKKTWSEHVKEVLNLGKVKRVVRVGAELFTAAQPFLEKPTMWSGAKAAFSIGKVFVDDMEFWADDYFAGDEWIQPYSRDFNQTILKVIAKKPYQTLKTSDETNVVRIVDVADGIKIGYVLNSKMNSVDHLYVETMRLKQAKETIKALLWKQYKDSNLVMRQNKRLGSDGDDARVIFEQDDAFHPMPSKRATEYSIYLQKCIAAGVARSVMLYGPPGTGKSTMARTIVDSLKMRSFRIRVEDVSGLESSTLFEAITIFEPDAIILDDFDRAHAQAQLLETLEFFQRHVKLVIATVNDRNSLDEAILRPGRFDELVCIKQMDEDVVKMVLGPKHADAFDTVKDWPIAFIEEYVKRRQFMTPEEAAESTIELARRVKRLEKYDDDDDVSKMEKLAATLLKKHAESETTAAEESDADDDLDDMSDVFAKKN